MSRFFLPAVACLTFWACRSSPPPAPDPRVAVKVVRATSADVPLTVQAPALVFPQQQANIAARLTAPIRALLVRKGDSVAAHQLLARLENADLLAQRLEAAAALADAEATLGKLSAGTLPAEIERARGQLATTRAALHQAQTFFDRRQQLFAQGAIPQRDLLVAETELATAQANHDVALKTLQLLESQSSGRDLEIARSRVEQARGRLAFIDAQLSYTEIRSPFAGAVTEQFLFPGDMARPDAPIFTISDLTVAVARAQLPETDAANVRPGASCALTPSDRPADSFPGAVTVINRALDPSRRTVEVWCEIPNHHLSLRAGVFGSVTIITGTLRQVVLLPRAALQFEEGSPKALALIVDPQGKAQPRSVETAPAPQGHVAILRGLQPGELVIVEGGYNLPPDTPVEWVNP